MIDTGELVYSEFSSEHWVRGGDTLTSIVSIRHGFGRNYWRKNGRTIYDRVLFPGKNKSVKETKWAGGGVVSIQFFVSFPKIQEMRKVQKEI